MRAGTGLPVEAADTVGEPGRPPYGWAALAGGLVFLLYVVTLAPTTAFWDASEYIATAQIMGIPHQPGNPLFVVLARAWILLLEPLGLSVAVRVNLFSAFMSASAHAFWFLVMHHVLGAFSGSRRFRLIGAGAAVLVSATAYTVWNQSNVNEKVYTIALLTIALLSWLAIRWRERVGRGGEGNTLVLMAFVLALSVGNHLMAFLAAPALALYILRVDPKTLLSWRLYPPVLLAAFVGLSIHLFLPIRSEFDPLINEGAPECEVIGEALVSVVTYGRAGCEGLSEAITREAYKAEGVPGPGLTGPRQASLSAQAANYLQYFDWQWARGVEGTNPVFAGLRTPFTLLFIGLGLWGAVAHFRKERESFWYFLLLFGTLSAALTWYLNFKYGYTLQAPVQDLNLHEVRERDYFFVASFSVWGLWAGLGIATLWHQASQRFSLPRLRTAPILGLALIPLVANWGWADRSYDHAARDWAHNLLMSVEPYGVLLTAGDNDTFPLWYLQEVEGIRRDVTVVIYTYLNSPWYARQLRDLTRPCPEGTVATEDSTRIICQRVYTATNTDSMYVHDPAEAGGKIPLLLTRAIHEPTRSILPMDDATIDRVGGSYGRLERDQVLELGAGGAGRAGVQAPRDGVTVTLRRGRLILPWMQYALAIINQAMGDRPVYFSSNVGVVATLGLQPYLVRQGVAFKLSDGPPAEGAVPGAVQLAQSPYLPVTGGWVDEARTRTLLDRAFVHHSGIPEEWNHWPDHSTVGIPAYYSWAYLSLTLAANQVGDVEAADRYAKRAQAWAELGS